MTPRRSSIPGLLAALLALMAQLVVATAMPRVDGPLGGSPGLLSDVPLCHSDDGAHTTPAPPQPHPANCPICPHCALLAVQAALPASSPRLPSDRSALVIARTAMPPPATAPPPVETHTARPRAPPLPT
jgi:hypothetical protein